MKIVSNNIKNALKQPTTQRKGRILVNGSYYEVYNVEYYADAYNEGNVIGNAIASQLDFDLPYMNKFETFKYYDGVWTGAEYEYVDMGTFTVFDEQDEDEFNKHITAFDNLIKFNQLFQDVGGYPKTLYQELENICSQAEVELQNESIPNGNFIVENNQFVEGENLKTVLKAIEQISGTYGIIKNDKLVLQLKNQTTEEITKNEHEPITWKRRSYGINQVILGMEDVQGEYVLRQDDEDIAINGVHKLVINDNPFIYTQQKREEVIDELFNQVKGFGYVPYDLKMEWLNYMDIGDTITIDGVETLILRMYGKSPKSLESEISAPAIIDSAIEYSNNTFSLSKRVSRTEFGVDKNAREIQAIVETTETIQKEINPPENASGSEIIVEDASNNPLLYLEVEGKSTQETRSGKNKFNLDAITTNYIEKISVEESSFNITNCWATEIMSNTNVTKYFEPSTEYTVTAKITLLEKPVSLSDGNHLHILTLYNDTRTYDLLYYSNKNAMEVNNTVELTCTLNTPADFTNLRMLAYNYLGTDADGNVQYGKFKIENLMVRKATETNSTFEPYGVSPSPDYPSEIRSVGYENLFDVSKISEKTYLESATGNTGTSSVSNVSDYIKVKANKTYILNFDYESLANSNNRAYCFYDENKNFLSGGDYYPPNKQALITPTTDGYIRFGYDVNCYDIQVVEGKEKHSYIPYGKYGIEVETVGKNLWDNSKVTNGNIITNNGTGFKISRYESMPNITGSYEINLKANTTYYISFKRKSYTTTNGIVFCRWKKSDGTFLWAPNLEVNQAFTPTDDIIAVNFYLQSTEADGSYVEIEDLQIEEGSEATNFEPYQKNTLLMILNSPLKSLPNGVKDIAYIKNNRLYVDHYVGSEVFDGSRDWWLHSGNQFRLKINGIRGGQRQLSTHFRSSFDTEIGCIVAYQDDYLRVFANFTTLDEFKAWLSTNNVQVYYELAEPYTEEIGEIETLKTLLGYNKITTTDDLQPTLNITYVRDTVLADYVENHIAELKINEEQISQRVETIDTSVDGLQTDISRVEQITTDTSQVLNIVSTNIDKTTGEVREVTTTTGFTFNKDGMTIDDGSGFKAEHRADGTYYKDGTSTVGQYTKDGSKQKDLELFGTYSYGKRDIEDTPMFVGQLYTDENGNEGFGHFYNGGDY